MRIIIIRRITLDSQGLAANRRAVDENRRQRTGVQQVTKSGIVYDIIVLETRANSDDRIFVFCSSDALLLLCDFDVLNSCN